LSCCKEVVKCWEVWTSQMGCVLDMKSVCRRAQISQSLSPCDYIIDILVIDRVGGAVSGISDYPVSMSDVQSLRHRVMDQEQKAEILSRHILSSRGDMCGKANGVTSFDKIVKCMGICGTLLFPTRWIWDAEGPKLGFPPPDRSLAGSR
jgi:hypothetical protein